MSRNELISRRTALQGMGVAVSLPLLESMTPAISLAAEAASTPPKRMAFVYVPNGIHMPDWTPRTVGSGFTLPKTLEPLKPFRDDMLVLSGLTLDKARSNGDGGGDHARAMAAFLTGQQPRKTHGADIQAGVSVDQFAAKKIGEATRFPTLEIGCEGGRLAGNCDSGYSCAYSNTISWRTESTPNPKEVNPREVFDRLFGGTNRREAAQSRNLRTEFNQSILDFVREDAKQLQRRLSSTDQRRMDEYLTSIRDVERRIQASDSTGPAGIARPTGIPKSYGEHIRIMADLLVLAFQADLTRIGTFVFANEGSNRNYRHINIPEGHHSLSHHQNNKRKQAKLQKINRFHIEQFAYMLDRLKKIREGDSTLLDNCMIVYGSGNSDGNRHNHDDLPILLVGKGGSTIDTGRHVRYRRNTPLMNLHLQLMDRMGVKAERFGDSTGPLPNLTV